MPNFTELSQVIASLPRVDLVGEGLFALILLLGLFGVCLFVMIPVENNNDIKALFTLLIIMITIIIGGGFMAKMEFLPPPNSLLASVSRGQRIISGFRLLGFSFIGLVGFSIISIKFFFYWLRK